MNDVPPQPLEPERLPLSPAQVESDPRPNPPTPRPPRRRLPLILFLLTCASTLFAGTLRFAEPKTVVDPATGKLFKVVEVDPKTGQSSDAINWLRSLFNGLTYATAVMAMLGAHEMGHYLQARRYGVPASLPMFIPMPFGPLGTMGAVIVQRAGVADRKAMFDIAISGPLAGLAVAIPLNWWGIEHSHIEPIDGSGFGFTNPLLVEWMIGWILRPLKPGDDIALNPILFAGWVGFFITALNLIPIGQLDGGHILYCLVGKRAHHFARGLYFGAVGFVAFQVMRGQTDYLVWTLMLILVWLMGTRHPPTANDHVPLGITRVVLGWLTLAFILVGFVPLPFYEGKAPPDRTPIHQSPEKDQNSGR